MRNEPSSSINCLKILFTFRHAGLDPASRNKLDSPSLLTNRQRSEKKAVSQQYKPKILDKMK